MIISKAVLFHEAAMIGYSSAAFPPIQAAFYKGLMPTALSHRACSTAVHQATILPVDIMLEAHCVPSWLVELILSKSHASGPG